MILFHGSPKQGLKNLTPGGSRSYPEKGPIVFASPLKAFAACFCTYWRDGTARVGTSSSHNGPNVPYDKVEYVSFEVWDNDVDLDSPCSIYEIDSESFDCLRYKKDIEWYSSETIPILKEHKYKTAREAFREAKVKFSKIDVNPRKGKAKMGFIDTVKNSIDDVVKYSASLITKDYLMQEAHLIKDCLNDCIWGLSTFQNPIDGKVISATFRQDPQYNTFLKKLSGLILNEESYTPTTAVSKLCQLYILELDHLIKNVSVETELNKSKKLKDIKMSQIAYMGFLQAASNVERFAKAFIFKGFCAYEGWSITKGVDAKIGNDTFKKKFKPFYDHIGEHMDFMTDQMNSFCSPLRQPTMIEKIRHFFKGSAYDPVIIIDNKPNTSFLGVLEETYEVATFSIFGLPSLNLFRHGANIYINWRHSRIIRKQHEKTIMENYKLALEMKKRNVDSESAEYKKLSDVIDSYNDMILDVSADIDEYYNKK